MVRGMSDTCGAKDGWLSLAHILCIDDERIIVRAITRLLSDRHDVVGVLDARAALAMLAKGERFDVILCDLAMPDVGGVDFVQTLELQGSSSASLVVFLTAGATTEEDRLFLASGRYRCIDKPFTAAGLSAAIDAALVAQGA
jgi:CheY-like chemotaxis protein